MSEKTPLGEGYFELEYVSEGETPFSLTDEELDEVLNGVDSEQTAEAIREFYRSDRQATLSGESGLIAKLKSL